MRLNETLGQLCHLTSISALLCVVLKASPRYSSLYSHAPNEIPWISGTTNKSAENALVRFSSSIFQEHKKEAQIRSFRIRELDSTKKP
ncbi:hypothetical protein L1887_25507 [Cichorium endivia]|nr:hypothetical protein L1887_25507 [Cichorium endivia]